MTAKVSLLNANSLMKGTFKTHLLTSGLLANVLKDSQASLCRKSFSSFSSAKAWWIFSNSVRGSILHYGNFTAVRNSFGLLIVDKKMPFNSITFVFSSLRYQFGKLIEEAPFYTAGSASFCYWAVSKKLLRYQRRLKPM